MKTYKITVIGDIMGELPVLRQGKKADGSYDFTPAMAELKTYFDEADYCIGNLETPLAGEAAGYTPNIYSFNTPDEMAKDLKELGIDAVTTANNHMFDRGMEGLKRTCRILDEAGLAHTGTYTEVPEDRNLYFTVGDTRIALLSYTYSCNYFSNKHYSAEGLPELGNFLRPYDMDPPRLREAQVVYDTRAFVEELLGRKLGFEEMARLRRAVGQPVDYADDAFDTGLVADCMAQIRADYEKARAKADLVFICPHSGGQFNTRPGKYSAWLYSRCAEMGFDAVLAAHSHTTQRAEKQGKTVIFNSLGNVTMSPHTDYSVKESLPEYGAAAHLYVAGGKLLRTGFSLFKMVEPEGGRLRAIPVDKLAEELPEGLERSRLLVETAEVFERISGRPFDGLAREWELF